MVGLLGPQGLLAETRNKLAAACVKATVSQADQVGATRLNSALDYRDAVTFAVFATSEASSGGIRRRKRLARA